ncbi:MAG: hypothetical protein Q9164_006109 [Protoblastenia rupestris]
MPQPPGNAVEISVILLDNIRWHEEIDERAEEHDVKPFPSEPVSHSSFAAIMLASLLALVAMIWQHSACVTAAATIQKMAYGTVKGEVGGRAMVLGWVGLVFLLVSAIGIWIMIMSIKLLNPGRRLITLADL